MTFQPVNQTKIVEESDRWDGVIPPLGEGNSGSFQIFVKDVNQNTSVYPRHKSIFIKSPVIVTSSLVINEFCADNDNVIPDSAGEYDDWIEIFNPTNETVILSGMYLTDKPDNLTKWQFPENISIGTGEFLIVWCDEEQAQGNLHTNFALSANGEFIGLTSPDRVTVIDSITFGPQTTDISYGRSTDGSSDWQFFNQPTPGSSNNPSGVNEQDLASDYILSQNYPNPFNPVTKIKFRVSDFGMVSLKVYDILGNEIAVLISKELAAGIYEVELDGSSLTSGVYFYRLESFTAGGKAGKFISARKMILLK
jgi:hypothetical protein